MNAAFASALIFAASSLASSETSFKDTGGTVGDAGTDDGGVVIVGVEDPDEPAPSLML